MVTLHNLNGFSVNRQLPDNIALLNISTLVTSDLCIGGRPVHQPKDKRCANLGLWEGGG